MFIATVIAAKPDATSVGEGNAFAQVATKLEEYGCNPGAPRWIDEGVALDIPFTTNFDEARAALKNGMDGFDIAVQVEATRKKMLLVADMDSTMITVECIDELADYAGIKPQIAEITERAMQGELDFAEALDARVALLEGMGEQVVAACLKERVTLMPGARTLIQTMKGWGAKSILVSGGFTHFAEPVAAQIGFDEAYANRLGFADGKLTGKVAEPIVDSAYKLDTLNTALERFGIEREASLAVGDGANDIPMIEGAGTGFAYHAKQKARDAADVAVNFGDLTALLYAQGVSRSEWVVG